MGKQSFCESNQLHQDKNRWGATFSHSPMSDEYPTCDQIKRTIAHVLMERTPERHS